MTTHFPPPLLHEQSLSLEHDTFAHLLATTENLLIIQDLDGVCMELVKKPFTRFIDLDYVRATQAFEKHFYVLTNGEHIGHLGVNGIVERAAGDPAIAKTHQLYLPGLAAGGVQWQGRDGIVSHPSVSDAELAFLAAVPDRIRTRLHQFFHRHASELDSEVDEQTISNSIDIAVLATTASPTSNLNAIYELLHQHIPIYIALQHEMAAFMEELLHDADRQGLSQSFFVHYAPNLGQDTQGKEILCPAQANHSGTTDFQFMLLGAVKETGVLFLLNHYYFHRTGTYPLGETFNVRRAPKQHNELLNLVKNQFDPSLMPTIVGIGDTVTSTVVEQNGHIEVRRGGSDRNFLQLIQDIGRTCNTGNLVVYVDSSQGEVKNRKPLKLAPINPTNQTAGNPSFKVIEGPDDPRDITDPLQLNLVFPGGHKQYVEVFKKAAQKRQLANPEQSSGEHST